MSTKAQTLATETYQDGRIEMVVEMLLRELMRGFFDKLKNISSGYASLSYEILSERPADVVRLDVLVAEEPVPRLRASWRVGGWEKRRRRWWRSSISNYAETTFQHEDSGEGARGALSPLERSLRCGRM